MATEHFSPAWVEDSQIDAGLRQLESLELDPRHGLFGPGAMYWEVNRHTLPYFLGAVQSVQFQLCHPWVATAIKEHSKIMSDPRARARQTYFFLWSIIYGDRELVLKRARALYRIHQRVQGEVPEAAGDFAEASHYQANEMHAMLWVHITAVWSRVYFYAQLVRSLTSVEKNRLVQEAKIYALCFGLPSDMHPENWEALEQYMDSVLNSGQLAATAAGLEVRRFLENSIPRPVRSSVWLLITLGLPQNIRNMLQQPEDNEQNRARFAKARKRFQLLNRLLPGKLRYVPAYHEALARLAGRDRPDWLTSKLLKASIGQPRLVSRQQAAP